MIQWLKGLTPEQLLLLNGTIVTLLVVYFWTGRTGARTPNKLNMSKGEKKHQPPTAVEKAEPQTSSGPKQLNVIFVYNQHAFDAYEVLGIPAGSSMAVVKEAYDDLHRELGGKERPLVDAAFEAIKKVPGT